MSDTTRHGPRLDMGSEDHDGFDVSTRQPMADYSQAAKPSAVPMISLLISMVALGLAVWALAAPPASPLLTAPPPPGLAQAPAGDRVAFLEQDIQKALLHLVTIERRLQKLEGRVNTLAKGQAEIAARPAPEPTAEVTAEATEPPATPQPTARATQEPKPAQPQKQTYKVRPGDTLTGIAGQYKVDLDDLCKWNNMSKRSTIKVGQRLVIYK